MKKNVYIHNPISNIPQSTHVFETLTILPYKFSLEDANRLVEGDSARTAYFSHNYQKALEMGLRINSNDWLPEVVIGSIGRGAANVDQLKEVYERLLKPEHKIAFLEAVSEWIVVRYGEKIKNTGTESEIDLDDNNRTAKAYENLIHNDVDFKLFISNWITIVSKLISEELNFDSILKKRIVRYVSEMLIQLENRMGKDWICKQIPQNIANFAVRPVESISKIEEFDKPIRKWLKLVTGENSGWTKDDTDDFVGKFKVVLYEFHLFEKGIKSDMFALTCSLANSIRNLVEFNLTRLLKKVFILYVEDRKMYSKLSGEHYCTCTGNARNSCKILGGLLDPHKSVSPGYFSALLSGYQNFVNRRDLACDRLSLLRDFIGMNHWVNFFEGDDISTKFQTIRKAELLGKGVHNSIYDYSYYKNFFFIELLETDASTWLDASNDLMNEMETTLSIKSLLSLMCDPRNANMREE